MVVFLSNNQSSASTGNPPEYVRRRRDGCSECRRKKVKCDLGKPVCSRCIRYPRECTYDLTIVRQAPKPQSQYLPSQIPKRVVAPIVNVSVLANQPSLNLSPFLSSTESKFFMHVLSTETAPVLFPAAPRLFVERLISAAVDTPHLLYALLASACSHHSRLVGYVTAQSQTLCLKFTHSAISHLRTAMAEPNEVLRPETAMTAMTLCTNDVCNGNMHIWRCHLAGAMQLLTAMLSHQSILPSQRDPFMACLVKWFTTLDVLACVSGIGAVGVHESQFSPLNMISGSDPAHVDDICGYSLELIPILARVGRWACQTAMHAAASQELPFESPEELIIEAQIIENSLFSLIGKTASEATFKSHGSELASELQYTHLAFVHSTLLYLHRRVQLLPKDHPTVKADIGNILDAVENIRPFSPSNILILWPIFNAGCETDTLTERTEIQIRMANMQSRGMGNFTRARDLMRAFWAAKTSLPWDTYLTQIGRELVLF